ncbi:MAG: HPr family phosphocarrier protein [Proteobacteria bacterium]|jgi:phosphocarrier protein|nr:HPr family phosphocarrier protein [Alphaproteobacteria bacterium]NCC04159.1 HPr family phosphocarrier protein [Pseudomonadota bacterium]
MNDVDHSRSDELCEMVNVVNKRGLHARAAAKFAQMASSFKAEVYVAKGDMRVEGRSIMGLMLLAAAKGSCLKICASGEEAAEVTCALGDLVRRGFDEE